MKIELIFFILLLAQMTVEECTKALEDSWKTEIEPQPDDNSYIDYNYNRDRYDEYGNQLPRERRVKVIEKATITCFNISFSTELPSTMPIGQNPTYPTIVTISDSNITKIPPSFFIHYQPATKLHLTNIQIKDIVPGAFNGLNRLQDLYLNQNNLEEIIGGQYNSLHLLRILNLSQNKIKAISEISFTGMKLLMELYLNQNYISFLPDSLFDNQHLLNILNLATNSLTGINQTFLNLSISKLDLSGNGIRKIDFEYFPSTLNFLYLSNNSIDFLKSWETLNLTDLYLDRNNISQIYIIEVERLKLSSNRLTKVYNQTFSNSLVSLDLGSNEISQLESDSFFDLDSLQKLSLNDNNLTTIPNMIFKDLTSLNFLDLSDNKIVQFQYGLFDNLLQLNNLNISYNKIVNLQEEIFHSLKILNVLDVQSNHLDNLNVDKLLSYSHILTISLDKNDWECKILVNIIHILRMRNIKIIYGTSFNDSNVMGIACKESDDFETSSNKPIIDISKIEKIISNKINSELKNLKFNDTSEISNSFMNHYFNKDFQKSNFYKYLESFKTSNSITNVKFSKLEEILDQDFSNTSMYNYFNRDFQKSNFYKYLEKFKGNSSNSDYNLKQFLNSEFFNSSLYNYFNKDFQNSKFFKYLESFKETKDKFEGNVVANYDFSNSVIHKYFNDDFMKSSFYKYFESFKNMSFPSVNYNTHSNIDDKKVDRLISEIGSKENFNSATTVNVILIILMLCLIILIGYVVFFQNKKIFTIGREQMELISNSESVA